MENERERTSIHNHICTLYETDFQAFVLIDAADKCLGFMNVNELYNSLRLAFVWVSFEALNYERFVCVLFDGLLSVFFAYDLLLKRNLNKFRRLANTP